MDKRFCKSFGGDDQAQDHQGNSQIDSEKLDRELHDTEMAAIALQFDVIISRRFKIGLLSHECRLVFQLLAKGSLSVKDASLSSTLSSRAFYELLKRLKNDSIIASHQDHDDRRSKRISLSEHFRDELQNVSHDYAITSYNVQTNL